MRRLALALLAAAVVVAVLGLPTRVEAHALRQSSQPADGALLDRSPAQVTITFGEEPDPHLSRIEVLDTGGQAHQRGAPQVAPGDPSTLVVGLPSLASGVYTVSWRTVSAVDGHRAAGTFVFGIGVGGSALVAGGAGPPGSSGSSGSSALPPLGVVGRWLLYVGLILLVGAAAVGVVAFPEPPRPALRLAVVAWVLAAVGAALVVTTQAIDAEVGVGQLVGSSIGRGLVERAVVAAAGAVAVGVAAAASGACRRRVALASAGVAGAAAMLVDVLGSHAAAGSLPVLNIALQWVHVTAGGIWLGGLATLLLCLRGQPRELRGHAVRTFSAAAGIALAVVFSTGVARAAVEIGAWSRVLTTAFGLLVVAKLALLAVLAALGAVNRRLTVPRAEAAPPALRRVGSTELGVAAAVLLIAATLVNLAPPTQSAAASGGASTAAPLAVDGADFATTVRVHLEVSPGAAGFNSYSAQVDDYDTRRAVSADGVELRFSLPARPDLGGSSLALHHDGDDRWSGQGGNLSLDGAWVVTVLVARAAQSVEVQLGVPTRSAPAPTDVSRFSGQPTLYTLHLPGRLSVQSYLDPQTPGRDEFHATFFDASGSGLAATGAVITETPDGGLPLVLPVRLLEPGHYVADATLARGRYRFDITATAPSGDRLGTHLELSVGE